MIKKDGAETKRERIAKMAQMIHAWLHQAKEQGLNYIPLKKTAAKLEFEFGLTKEKIMMYLEVIEQNDQIEIDAEIDQIRKLSVV